MNAKSLVIAGAAALLLINGAVSARADESAGAAQVKCVGVNSCKGQGMEKMSSAKDCTDKGGTVQPDAKKAN